MLGDTPLGNAGQVGFASSPRDLSAAEAPCRLRTHKRLWPRDGGVQTRGSIGAWEEPRTGTGTPPGEKTYP